MSKKSITEGEKVKQASSDLMDDQPLVRFMSLASFCRIAKGSLWCRSLVSMAEVNDPGEGNPDMDTKLYPSLHEFHQELMEYASGRDDIRFYCDWEDLQQARLNTWLHYLREHRAVSCWFLGPFESYPMWEAYAKHGVAIETTVGKLKAAIGFDPDRHRIGRVLYYSFNWSSDGPRPDAIRRGEVDPCFLKNVVFEAEREVRLVSRISSGEDGIGLRLKCPLEEWITQIIVYPYKQHSDYKRAREQISCLAGERFPLDRITASQISPTFATGASGRPQARLVAWAGSKGLHYK